MKVRELCSRSVRTCGPNTSLADAGWSMWEGDCGILPVVDEGRKLVGVLTDRDICMSVSTNFRPAAAITAKEACSKKSFSCALDDGVDRAAEIMRREAVRRLPVVDAEGRVQGILSLNDIALAARPADRARPGGVTYEQLVSTMQAICAHRERPLKSEKLPLPAPSRVVVSTAS
jgi:CBS domain-containing protein